MDHRNFLTKEPMQLGSLKSHEQSDVANALTEILLSVVPDDDIANRLRNIRDKVWLPYNNDSISSKCIPNHEQKKEAFDEALIGLDSDRRKLLFESYARMGELYELAGLVARDNYLNDLKGALPGGVQEFAKNLSLQTVIEALSKPVFEIVMTMHPTNIQGIKPMKALRNIAKELHAGNSESDIKKAVADYQNTPILHQVNGNEINLTVRDETKTVINYLGNIYEDLPSVFKQYDVQLSKQYGGAYNGLDLKLNARFGSWGSAGDKDGNDNVTAEKTLEALVRHTYEIVHRYNFDLAKIDNVPELADWKLRLAETEKNLETLLLRSEKLTDDTDSMRDPQRGGGDSKQFENDFNIISSRLAEIRKGLDAKAFENDLTKMRESYKKMSSNDADKLLDMVRKVRWFGFVFSKVEYRETAEEYEKVLNKIIPGYSDLKPSERVLELTRFLNEGIPDNIKVAAKNLVETGTSKSLAEGKKSNDASAIAYHTLKRMELARDQGDMIRDNVLAECAAMNKDKYPVLKKLENEDQDSFSHRVAERAAITAKQGEANLLEAVFLQRLVDKPDKKALLGIVPLFEDPDTMQNVDHIMESAYKNNAYHNHLQKLADDRHDGKVTQQVQIAHSDNRRRSGSLAGTAFIHEAHNKLRKVNKDNGIETQFFEGGSMSDAYRNGIRAISAQVNAYGLQNFAKFTFQGRDLQNYFNYPGSVERVFTRQFVHPASSFLSDEHKAARNGVINGDKLDRTPNSVLDEIAIAALKRTLQDYTKDDFSKEAIGTLLAVLDYNKESTASNRGSRAASRGVAFSSGAATTNHIGAAIDPIAVDKLRTIPFSMMPQQNQLSPAWIGGQNLGTYIAEEIEKHLSKYDSNEALQGDVRFFKEKFADWNKDKSDLNPPGQYPTSQPILVPPKYIKLLYEKSPVFRDAMDKSAFAVARTDITAIQNAVENKALKNDAVDSNAKIISDAKSYVERLGVTFSDMGNIVYAALTGNPIQGKNNELNPYARYSNSSRKNDEQAIITQEFDSLNGLGQAISERNNYQDFVVHAKSSLENDSLHDHNLAVLLSAGLTSTHSRWPMADDVEYGRSRAANYHRGLSIN